MNERRSEIQQNAESMQEVTRHMQLLSSGSVREGRHCLSVKSSIVTLTQNDSVGRDKTITVLLLLSQYTNALHSYVNEWSICQKKPKLTLVPLLLVKSYLHSDTS